MKGKRVIALILTCGIVLPAAAEERVDMQGATITGDRELPKILYIVPWRSPFESDVVEDIAPVGLMTPRLAPLDRDEFRRVLEYQDTVRTNRLWRVGAR